jgi:hypothetical protein
MQAGNSANVATSASLFGAGMSAGSSSSRLSRVEDGRIDACQAPEQGPGSPPRNCSALIRVHLVPIAAAAEVTTRVETAAVDVACPAGTVLSEGKCTKPATGVTHRASEATRRTAANSATRVNARAVASSVGFISTALRALRTTTVERVGCSKKLAASKTEAAARISASRS